MAETWRPFHDALALRPTASFIPDSSTVMEHTGKLLSQFEEGNTTANNYQKQQPLHVRKTSFIQTSSQILLRIPVKRNLPQSWRKVMKRQVAKTLFHRLLTRIGFQH
jgi:hypothetical protein